jgi:hypothetical protein
VRSLKFAQNYGLLDLGENIVEEDWNATNKTEGGPKKCHWRVLLNNVEVMS